MSDMIERVARALCREIGVPEDGLVLPHRPQPGEELTGEVAWKIQMPKARAAIRAHDEALAEAGYVVVPREPTKAMTTAGLFAVHTCFSSEQGEGLIDNPAGPVWKAMCDKALEEK